MIKTNKANSLLEKLESEYLKSDLPELKIGQTVKIGLLIKEGDKKRTQFSEGVIISKNNSGINTTITVRKIFQGGAIERVYLLHSPLVQSIQILKKAKVRRSKLYYLRGRVGKATRLKQILN